MSDTNPEWIQDPLPGLEPDETTRRAERLNELRSQNRDLVAELHQAGGVLNPGAVALVQLQTLLDLALSAQEREEFELAFEARMGDSLRSTVSALRKAQLTAPINPTHSKIVNPFAGRS